MENTTLTNQQESRARQMEALRRHLGTDLLKHLEDKTVVEIMLNSDGRLWVDMIGDGMHEAGAIDPIRSLAIINSVAALHSHVVTSTQAILECELPVDGSRFEALIPPLVAQPIFTIRKKALLIFTLDDYLSKEIITPGQKQVIEDAVLERKNILVAGGTGTGKTTLANAILHAVSELDPDHRIVIIEDTQELQCAAKNVSFLRTSEEADMTRLLRATMRLRPDRIVVGEVRDGSALALLKAWNTGHPGGVGTVHANSASAALVRIGQLIQEAGVPPNPDLIAEAVNVVVSIKRTLSGRVVDEIAVVNGYENGKFIIEKIG